jgi:tetratricopeptide (TPR) repeat protein
MSRAERYFRAAAEASPMFVDSSVNLAALLNAQGRHSEAAAILESVLRLQPDHEKARLQFQMATETSALASETSSSPDSGSPPSDGKGE